MRNHEQIISKETRIRESPRVCQLLLGKSCALPTSKKICHVKKKFISNNLAKKETLILVYKTEAFHNYAHLTRKNNEICSIQIPAASSSYK
jgi:hypothetical protein